jgi:hypothetical protein
MKMAPIDYDGSRNVGLGLKIGKIALG